MTKDQLLQRGHTIHSCRTPMMYYHETMQAAVYYWHKACNPHVSELQAEKLQMQGDRFCDKAEGIANKYQLAI